MTQPTPFHAAESHRREHFDGAMFQDPGSHPVDDILTAPVFDDD
jgi:hypothetical protein